MKKDNLVGFKLKDFHFISVLGSGNFSVVYEAVHDITKERAAIKAIPLSLVKQKKKLQELIKTEIKVLKSCNNENVIKSIATFKSSTSVFIATQFCNGGDMQQYLNKKGRLQEDQATNFLKQILNGFKGLHQVKAMHRDFKLANLLLHNGILKIADLGFAKQMQKESLTKTNLGTGLNMAPQILDQKPYGMKADIWSIGVVYYQMIFGKYPYYGQSDPQIIKKIKTTKPDFSAVKISPQGKNFIERCLTLNVNDRISWGQIYDHPLISQKATSFIYHSVNPHIEMQKNKDYYKNQIETETNFIYPQKKQFITQGFQISEVLKEQQQQPCNYANLKEQSQQYKNLQKQIASFQSLLFKKRNNIMFLIKFLVPKVLAHFLNVSAHHYITLFFILKKTYLDLKQFFQQLQEKQQKKNLQKSWNQFINSINCFNFLNLLKQQIQSIKVQMVTYTFDIQEKHPQMQAEVLNLQKCVIKDWKLVYDELLNQYWFELAEYLSSSLQKQILIQVLRALQFYKTTTEVDVDVFQKILQTMDYNECQGQIYRKLYEQFQ